MNSCDIIFHAFSFGEVNSEFNENISIYFDDYFLMFFSLKSFKNNISLEMMHPFILQQLSVSVLNLNVAIVPLVVPKTRTTKE